MRHLLLPALLLALPACATAPRAEDLSAYPGALVGTYDNAAQYAQAPDDLKRPPISDDTYDWIDQQTVTFSMVAVPALGPAVVYAQWRGGDGTVRRRRLWAFRREGARVQIEVYTLPDRAAGESGTDAAALAALGVSDVGGYGPACALTVTSSSVAAWNAQTDPDTCTTSQGGRALAIDVRVTVMPTGVLYQEAGRWSEGGYAFRTPGGAPYDFRRRP